ncbi:hypothetical protein F4777DRAFT_550065 [Nemania sp. FL0916]|nr:hypothetical protein F4777DRAFT_550065 [Nemania sp. FL0916]
MPSKTGDTARSLSSSINVATRSIHTKLNKLVISRLPLALPPQAEDASQYVSGLLHVAPIYIAFESLWKAALEPPRSPETHDFGEDKDVLEGGTSDPAESDPEDRSSAHSGFVVSPPIRSLLASLYFEKLQRSQVLERDLSSLTGWSSRTLAEQLNDASESPVLCNFLAHIRSSVAESPHILLAYGWVLYMALFSGGRFIRASLENIYPAFWVPVSAQRPAPATLANASFTESQPLNFFRFDTPEDGEDIKLEFKKRFLESESALTGPEREEIVQEACRIFDYMIQLISELDSICGTDKDTAEARLLSLRSRDSVVVEKERRQHSAETTQKVAAKAEIGRSMREDEEGHVKFS